MPRDGSGVYTLPFPDVVTNTTIASSVENGFQHDVANDLNAPRPIVAGGTGANSASAARTALQVETYGQIVTNYDSHVFSPGSFYSAGSATSPPVVGHAFVGSCAFVDANNMYLEAYDRDDAAQPGALWIRQKKAGTWSSWAKAQALNIVGTPVANQFTTWQSGTALQGVAITGLVKGNGASAPTAAVANTDYATPTYVDNGLALKAPLASPVLTGNPQAPNPPGGDNDASIATTAFVTTVAVRYDLAQSLTVAQKQQAKNNLFIAPTTQIFTSGSGTYTTPSNPTPLWIEVELIGGGGGGAGSGTAPGTPVTGGGSGFGPFVAGVGGAASGAGGGTGGSASGGYLNKAGSAGGTGSGIANQWGGYGAASPYGGGGVPGQPNQSAGLAAAVNSGAGGGGAGCGATVSAGGGGGAGGFVRGIIPSPAASYSYIIGVAGLGGTAGTGGSAGGNGGSGLIIVREFYG